MTTPRKKHSRLWVYLLYLGLVTSLILSVTLAKYVSTAEGTGTATVAAMAGGGEPIQMVLDDMYPGQTKTLKFMVVNYTNDTVSEVAMDYTIKVETTGNLPLTFQLTAEKAAGTSSEGTTVAAGEITADQIGQPLTGGFFPLVAGEDGTLAKQEHVYTLTATWPEENNNVDYADEIDLVTITVEASQRLAVPETNP